MNLDTRHNIAILTLADGNRDRWQTTIRLIGLCPSQPVLGCSIHPGSGFLLRLLRVWVRSQKRRWWRLKGWTVGDEKQRT